MLGVWAFTRFLKELTIMQEEKDNRGLKNFRRALLQVRAAIGPTIPTQLVQTFVDVALNEGTSLGELAELVGSNASTVSRHLLDLGERNRRMEPGDGLVDRSVDARELRQTSYFLKRKRGAVGRRDATR